MNKFLKISGIVAIVIFGLRFLSFYTYPEMDDKAYNDAFTKNYSIYSAPLPSNLEFAGESVPFNDPQIIENYDRELLVNTYWQSQTVLFIKRSNKYFPVIEPILKSYGIPQDFKYLPLIESGFMNVVSPAGAVGFWQIMEGTGKQYGLEITKEVDERYHLEKATHVACRYLKEAYAELGSWTLAAASYNMGITGVKKQLERQGASNFYDLTLNSETGRYVYRIMAVKHILENPEKSGFHIRKKDLYPKVPTYLVEVDTAVSDFGKFAESFGINYRILKYHNPWLRYDYLPNSSGKTYLIAIPEKGFHQIVDEQTAPKDISLKNDSLPMQNNDLAPVKTDSLAAGKQKVD